MVYVDHGGYGYHASVTTKEGGTLLEASRSGGSLINDAFNPRFDFETMFKAFNFAVQDGNLQMVTEMLDQWEIGCRKFVRIKPVFTNFLIGDDGGMVSSPVFGAVKAGHLQVVRKLITFLDLGNLEVRKYPWYRYFQVKPKGTQSVDIGYWFRELVQWAVRWGHVDIVKFLATEYQRLFDVRSEATMAYSLHLAAFHGHVNVLELILEWDKDPTLAGTSGNKHPSQMEKALLPSCFFHLALQPNGAWKEELVRRAKDGFTALHLAAQSGVVGAVELLVDKANMNGTEVSDPEVFTPLHIAANFGHVEVVNYFLSTERASSRLVTSRIMAKDCLGRTALHYAATEGHANVVQVLVDAHEDIALVQDYDGLLALHMAARAGHVDVIKALNPFGGITHQARHSLAVKSWVERENTLERGRTDLFSLTFYTVKERRDKLKSLRRDNTQGSLTFYPGKKWKFLRMKVFDSLFWRTKGFTPFHFAARYGYGAAVRELLKNKDTGKSALFMQDNGGFLAYDWMKVQKHRGIINNFLQHCISEGWNLDVNRMRLELEKEGSSSMMTSELSSCITSQVRGEKQAMKEIQRAWQSGNINGLEDTIYQMPMLQWLLDDDEVVVAPWHVISSLTIMPDVFHMLHQALQKANFTIAKHILLQYQSLGSDLSLDATRVSSRVKEMLSQPVILRSGHNLFWEYSSFEDFLIVLVTRKELTLDRSVLRRLLKLAKDNEITSLFEVLLDQTELKREFYEDRQLYVDCANAILVGAALIAGVAFQGWLQPPLGYSYEYHGSQYSDVHEGAVRVFWWFNNGSFFFAAASLIAGAKGSVPARHLTDIVESLEKVRRGVGVASLFLGMALVCVVGAFSAAGFAVLPPLASDLHIMQTCMAVGTTLCALALLWFGRGVLPLVTETICYLIEMAQWFLFYCKNFPNDLLQWVCDIMSSYESQS